MLVSYEEKCLGALLGAAIGDAYGWPYEQNSKNINVKERNTIDFIEWSHKTGGRFWAHEEHIFPGEYSDDTQLIIATLRSLLEGKQWSQHFIACELPAWTSYARGAGRATKRAAELWAKRKTPWETRKNPIEVVNQYFMAGGNGAAMRVLPHAFISDLNNEEFMKQVFINAMYTHGHPRAIIGAMLYAAAVKHILQCEMTLDYGELVRELLKKQNEWYNIPPNSKIKTWINKAEENNISYYSLWEEVAYETINLLQLIEQSLYLGSLDLTNETLKALGCFDKKVNGAGNRTAVICIYLFSKYADSPIECIRKAGSLKQADTDTIASMVGGLIGALHGTEWIPTEWRTVQDYEFFKQLISLLFAKKVRLDITSNSSLESSCIFNRVAVENMEVGEGKDFSPFGKTYLIERREEKSLIPSNVVSTSVLKTKYGQTLYVKKIEKISNRIQENFEYNTWSYNLNYNLLRSIVNIIGDEWKANDYLIFINDIVSRISKKNDVDMNFIEECCKRWEQYNLTVKQIKRVADLLKKASIVEKNNKVINNIKK